MTELEQIVSAAREAISATSSVADLEQAKARFLGKSGSLTEQLKSLGKLPADERPRAGAAINEAKAQVEALVQARRESILARELDAKLAAARGSWVVLSRPEDLDPAGVFARLMDARVPAEGRAARAGVRIWHVVSAPAP